MVYLIPNYFKFFVKIESSAECSAREEVVSSKFCCILIRLLNDDSLSGAVGGDGVWLIRIELTICISFLI